MQVTKIEVQYDKTSKQVDVQALKETLWGHIQESHQMSIRVSFVFLPFSDFFLLHYKNVFVIMFIIEIEGANGLSGTSIGC